MRKNLYNIRFDVVGNIDSTTAYQQIVKYSQKKQAVIQTKNEEESLSHVILGRQTLTKPQYVAALETTV